MRGGGQVEQGKGGGIEVLGSIQKRALLNYFNLTKLKINSENIQNMFKL